MRDKKEEPMSYDAYVKKDSDLTAAEIISIEAMLIGKILPYQPDLQYDVQVRSSVFAEERRNQYSNTVALPSLELVERVRSADIFLINLCLSGKNTFIQIHARGLGEKGRNVILIYCDNSNIMPTLLAEMELIFPGKLVIGKAEAAKASEKLDAETWDPDMDDDGEDSARDTLRAAG